MSRNWNGLPVGRGSGKLSTPSSRMHWANWPRLSLTCACNSGSRAANSLGRASWRIEAHSSNASRNSLEARSMSGARSGDSTGLPSASKVGSATSNPCSRRQAATSSTASWKSWRAAGAPPASVVSSSRKLATPAALVSGAPESPHAEASNAQASRDAARRWIVLMSLRLSPPPLATPNPGAGRIPAERREGP